MDTALLAFYQNSAATTIDPPSLLFAQHVIAVPLPYPHHCKRKVRTNKKSNKVIETNRWPKKPKTLKVFGSFPKFWEALQSSWKFSEVFRRSRKFFKVLEKLWKVLSNYRKILEVVQSSGKFSKLFGSFRKFSEVLVSSSKFLEVLGSF